MTSSPASASAFVWVWLPDATEPVVAGRLDRTGETLQFTYGRSYVARPEAIPIYLPELPLSLSEDAARTIIDRQIDTIERRWDEVCDAAALNDLARRQMWGTQFLNPFAFYGYEGRRPETVE